MNDIENFGIKKLDPNLLSFEANGKTYHNINTLSLARAIQFDLYLSDLTTGVELSNLQSELGVLYQMMNKRDSAADTAVKLHNLLTATQLNTTRTIAALKICCCFMCFDGENAKEALTDELIAEKIEDWTIEGYDRDSFFSSAVTFARGLAQK